MGYIQTYRSNTIGFGSSFIYELSSDFMSRRFDGKISEIISFNRELTTNERIQIHSYLSKKWGLETSVDSDGDGIADASDTTPAGLITQPKPASLQITFADPAGNTGAAVSRTNSGNTVDLDTSAPVLTTVSLASNNSDNRNGHDHGAVLGVLECVDPDQAGWHRPQNVESSRHRGHTVDLEPPGGGGGQRDVAVPADVY